MSPIGKSDQHNKTAEWKYKLIQRPRYTAKGHSIWVVGDELEPLWGNAENKLFKLVFPGLLINLAFFHQLTSVIVILSLSCDEAPI